MQEEQLNKAHDKAHGYSGRVHEVERWFRLLLENCGDDKANAATYVGNARRDVGDFMAEAATVQFFVEEYVLKMMTNKKTKNSPLTSAFSTLILAKILQQLKQGGAFNG